MTRTHVRARIGGMSVEGAYLTERDKAPGRKTLAWLYTMREPADSGKGELEIRFRKERGHWILRAEIIEAWSG